MLVLVVNCGSSSLKIDLLDAATGARRGQARVERVTDHAEALAAALPGVLGDAMVGAVGHRVVHGGERFSAPVRIDDEVEAAIEALSNLAPLHNPANLAGIRAARRLLPGVPHVAVFDTAFHATLPRRSRTYALPAALADTHGNTRYLNPRPSHAWVAARASEYLGADLRDLRLVTCHLGNGCSATAVEYSRSVETSCGMTPLEGLVMGTRSGDIDPGVVLHLARAEGLDIDALDVLLNRRSGLAGLSGVGNDMRDIEERAAAGDERCRLAVTVFCHRLLEYIGAYVAVMGGADAVVFTGGIGQNSALVRARVGSRLDFLGARLDEDRNRDARVDREHPVAEISIENARCRLLVVATDEEHAIARDTVRVAGLAPEVSTGRPIPVAVSARHVHLSPAAVEALFGPGRTLTPKRALTQPGQFAAEERVTLVGPKRSLENVVVVGPARGACQVEISRTDEFHLGLDAPIRASGDLVATPGIVLEGPAGRFVMESGVICSQRHIHMTPDDAVRLGVQHKDIVEVAVDTAGRDLVFGDVVVRVSPEFQLEMHVDTDEGNAAELCPGHAGVLARTDATARLRRNYAG
jgi:acetate kinase